MTRVDGTPALVRITSYPDGRDEIVTADPEGLVETVAGSPALRDLHPGTSSSYRLDTAVLEPAALVGLLRIIGTDPEDADLWPEEVAEQWRENGEAIEEEVGDLPWAHRWAEVNDRPVTAVALPDGRLQPVLVDDSFMSLETAEPLAEHSWSHDGGGRPMSTDGGNSIGLLSPGVLYEHQWGDYGREHHLHVVGTSTNEVGAGVADWVTRVEIDQTVALALEPIDPHGTLAVDERDVLRAQLDECGIAFSINREAVAISARERLAERNEHYRRTRDALAQPKSPDGEALFALVAAVAEGEDVPESLTFGTWMS